MNKSESITKIAPALAKAQGKIEGAIKDSTNTFFNNAKYADLSSVMDAIRDAMKENELAYVQPLSTIENRWYIETVIIHASGEWISSGQCEIVIKDKTNPQSFGSAVTYFRRYCLTSMVGVAQVDDDGNFASQSQHHPPAVKKPAVKRQPQVALSAMEKMELGKWVLPDGKYKGKKLGDIPQEEALSYRAEMLRSFGNIDAMPDAAFKIFDNLSEYYSELI